MKIAVLGAGSVGGTLGHRWAEIGHEVVFGLRPSSSRSTPPRTKHASLADAVRMSEVVALALPWPVTLETVRSLSGDLAGRVLLDCTNPLGAGMKLDVGPGGESGGERVASAAPGAHVVKIFNTTGYGNMASPSYGSAKALMLYAGDHDSAKARARTLAEDLGFDAVDAGALVRARELEHIAMMWIALAMGGMGREIAFGLLRR